MSLGRLYKKKQGAYIEKKESLMSQLIPHADLLQKAAAYIAETLKEYPERNLGEILDQAGMLFNLTPLDTEALQRLFSKDS